MTLPDAQEQCAWLLSHRFFFHPVGDGSCSLGEQAFFLHKLQLLPLKYGPLQSLSQSDFFNSDSYIQPNFIYNVSSLTHHLQSFSWKMLACMSKIYLHLSVPLAFGTDHSQNQTAVCLPFSKIFFQILNRFPPAWITSGTCTSVPSGGLGQSHLGVPFTQWDSYSCAISGSSQWVHNTFN